MANTNVRMHLSEVELWRADGIIEQRARHREVGERVWCGQYGYHPSLSVVPAVWYTYKTTWWKQKKGDYCGWGSCSGHPGTKTLFCNCNQTSFWPSKCFWGASIKTNHTHTFTWKWSAIEKTMYTDPAVLRSLPAPIWLGHGPCWLKQDK